MTDAIEIPEIDDPELTEGELEDIRCTLCGWIIEDLDLSTMTAQGPVHFDRQCPKGESKPAKPARKRSTKPATTTAETSEKAPSVASKRGTHAECEHPATKSARAACRKARAGK